MMRHFILGSRSSYCLISSNVKIKGLRDIRDLPTSSKATCFFDAEVQSGFCGASIFLNANDEHLFASKINSGKGTNTKVELLALGCLTKFDFILGIDTLKVSGDSLVIVNWQKSYVIYRSFPFSSGVGGMNLSWIPPMLQEY